MFSGFIGKRIKELRIEVLQDNQKDLANNINNYIKRKISAENSSLQNFEKNKFSQFHISQVENGKPVSKEKIVILINYLYDKKKINPSWIILENNNNQPMFAKKLTIDDSLSDIQDQINTKYEELGGLINSIQIIIQNTPFSK